MECYLQNNLEATVSFKEKKTAKNLDHVQTKLCKFKLEFKKMLIIFKKISRISSNISDDFLKRIVRGAMCPYKEGEGNQHGLKRRG